MAVIKYVPGIEVTVTVNGNDLKEYVAPEIKDKRNAVTRYVEVTSDSDFEISCFVKHGRKMKADFLSFGVTVDGQWITGKLVSSEKIEKRDYRRLQRKTWP